MTDDEIHNASIKDIYAKIINPEYKLSDIKSAIEKVTHPSAPVMQSQPAVQAQPAVQSQPVAQAQSAYSANSQAKTGNPVYLVQGARADSDLFRADSELNKAFLAQYGIGAAQNAQSAYVQPVQQTAVIEEENDDIRPTRTTIQYQTIDASGARISDSVLNAYREGEIPRPEEKEDAHSRLSFTKRDKIIMGIVLGLILSVFVLIIVNSAIISGLNTDIAALDMQLETAQQGYEQVLEEYDQATSYENVYEMYNNMVK